jgi:DNA-binding response OmpR family regulator
VTSGLSSNNNKKRILFVGDEPDLTSLFKKALESAGFSVNVFNNSADALKDFKSHFYDLVMLDIIMPKVDGFDLYQELRKVDPDVKICFLTASEKYHENLKEGEYQTLSKDLFIQKLLSIKKLIKEIHNRIGSTE